MDQSVNTENLSFKDSKYATGRRKKSIAKVWLKKGSGKITVNGRNYEEYFKRVDHKSELTKPFEIINQTTSYDVRCSVKGGGHSGQVGAMLHGISKALLQFDSTLKPVLKKDSYCSVWHEAHVFMPTYLTSLLMFKCVISLF